MEGVVEDAGEFVRWASDKHFDAGWDRVRKYVNGKKVEDRRVDIYRPVRLPAADGAVPADEHHALPAPSSSLLHHHQAPTLYTATPRGAVKQSQQQQQQRTAPAQAASTSASSSSSAPRRPGVRSASHGGHSRLRAPSHRPLDTDQHNNPTPTALVSLPASRRKQAPLLEPAATSHLADDCDSSTLIRTQNERNDRILQLYEAELDDPARNPASVLPHKDLWTLQKHDKSIPKQLTSTSHAGSRRDSGMASGYNDDYRGNSQYRGDGRSRSAQPPPKSRYYDDEDSDYDERSGRRYDGGGRGYSDRDRYDDRDYDRYVETTERYRGPPVDRRDSYARDAPYGEAGPVARRSDPYLARSQVSRRSAASRGRDRSYSRSRSRSRSRTRSRERGGENFQEKLQQTFDTTPRGLGVGLAGAVAGGLAGRQFGKQHRQRDIIIGAVVGGLLANAGENKWTEYREEKKREEEGMRYEGRSRSRGR